MKFSRAYLSRIFHCLTLLQSSPPVTACMRPASQSNDIFSLAVLVAYDIPVGLQVPAEGIDVFLLPGFFGLSSKGKGYLSRITFEALPLWAEVHPAEHFGLYFQIITLTGDSIVLLIPLLYKGDQLIFVQIFQRCLHVSKMCKSQCNSLMRVRRRFRKAKTSPEVGFRQSSLLLSRSDHPYFCAYRNAPGKGNIDGKILVKKSN